MATWRWVRRFDLAAAAWRPGALPNDGHRTGPGRYMKSAGLPLSSELSMTFTEVVTPSWLAYRTVVPFVPGREASEYLTTIELVRAGDGTRLVMTFDPLHIEEWTRQHHTQRVTSSTDSRRLSAGIAALASWPFWSTLNPTGATAPTR